MQFLYAGRIGRCWFYGGNLDKNPRSKAKTNNKLNPHMAPGRNQTRVTLVGGERSHNCVSPAPCKTPHSKCDMKVSRVAARAFEAD